MLKDRNPFRRTAAYLRRFDRNLWALSFGWFVSAMGFSISVPFIAIYFHADLGLTAGQIGIFFGVLAVIRSGFQMAGGEMSDRIERRMLLVHSQWVRAASFLFLAVAIMVKQDFLTIATGLTVNFIFGAVFQPAANAMVSDILPREQRLDGYALTRTATNLGWAVGPALGGFLAGWSYGALFIISAVLTLCSGLVLAFFMTDPKRRKTTDRFRLADIIAVKDDPFLARHVLWTFCLYLVVSQLIAPLSLYAVEMVGVSKARLGMIYTLNGLMVATLQVPVTRFFFRYRLTFQLALGAFLYAIGYTSFGLVTGFTGFIPAVVVITLGEMIMSPPSVTLTSRLAPEGRMGRYMGIYGFVVSAGWSFGPLYGGMILEHVAFSHLLAWVFIGSMALVAALGYRAFGNRLPENLDRNE